MHKISNTKKKSKRNLRGNKKKRETAIMCIRGFKSTRGRRGNY